VRERKKLFVMREKEYKEMNLMMKRARLLSMIACAFSAASLIGVMVCLVN